MLSVLVFLSILRLGACLLSVERVSFRDVSCRGAEEAGGFEVLGVEEVTSGYRREDQLDEQFCGEKNLKAKVVHASHYECMQRSDYLSSLVFMAHFAFVW
jgi:hypothetical protein